LYKIYKKIKYNQEDEEENYDSQVDPVNHYILTKNYTNKVKMSRLDRMKLISDRKKNKDRVEKFLKEKKSSETQQLIESNLETLQSKEFEDQAREVILKENIVKLTDEQLKEDEFDNFAENNLNNKDEQEEDEDWEASNDYYLNDEDEELEEDDLEEDEFNEEDYEEEELFTYNKDEEMDPSMLYFFVDCTDEELNELSEEDRKIIEAYRNSKKNSLLLRPRNKKVQKELIKKQLKKNGNNLHTHSNLNSQEDFQSNEMTKPAPNENIGCDELKGKTTPLKKEENLNNSINHLNTQNKRKNSVTSNGSNSKKKKNVSFRFNSNQLNGKDKINS
jgi:hypothetical protein